jgi:hypothetical protein
VSLRARREVIAAEIAERTERLARIDRAIDALVG